MQRTIGDKAGLSSTLNEFVARYYYFIRCFITSHRILDEAYGVFFDTLEAQARNLARTILVGLCQLRYVIS